MKKFLLLIMMCLISTKALADLSVFPQYINFVESDRKRSQTVYVINTSKLPQTYNVSIIEFSQDENGQYVNTETMPNSAAKYLMYSPKRFTLQPDKMQAIRIARKGMGDAKDGEYVSHLLVREVEMPYMKKIEKNKNEAEKKNSEDEEKNVSVSIHMLFANSVPITIYKGDNLSQATEILSCKQNGNKLDLVLQRKGNISSRLILKVYDANGEKIGQIGPIRIYIPNSKRNLSIELKPETKPVKLELYDALSNKKIMEKKI